MPDPIALIACACAIGVWWILIPLRAVQNERRLLALASTACDEPARWPLVSIVIPARNEADTISDAMQRLLEVDYPELEILLVNDRSSDRSGEIIDALAQRDPRVRALHVDALPEGWNGKVNALQRGLEVARGEWLLFTDADVHFAPATLKRAIAYCLQEQRSFLSLLPRFRGCAALVGAAQTVFGMILLSFIDSRRIADPRRPTAMGVGAFNLFQRSFLDAGEGLAWLRMEIADDAGLALMLKSRGASIDMLNGQDFIEVDWYPTLAAMFEGVMQRLIMGVNYYFGLYLLQCLLVVFCLAAPAWLTGLLLPLTPLAWSCLALYWLPSLIFAVGLRRFRVPAHLLWLMPPGFAVIGYGMLRTLVTYIRRGGLYWRGRVYPLSELRKTQRVKLNTFF